MITKNIVQRNRVKERLASRRYFEKKYGYYQLAAASTGEGEVPMRLAYLAADELANVSADAWREARAMTSR